MYLLDGLYPYTVYNVVIVALTDKGAGPASERLIVFTQEDRMLMLTLLRHGYVDIHIVHAVCKLF